MKHRVLIIASDFPPLAGTNTQRVQSFVRHLPRFGWEAVVMTRCVEDMGLIDGRQLERLAHDVRVLRCADPDIFAWLRRRRNTTVKDVGSESAAPSSDKPEQSGATIGTKKKQGMLRTGLRLASRVIMSWQQHLSYLPDTHAPWARRCASEGVSICRTQGIAVILASAPSYSCLVAGLHLSRRSGLPFVADFRDLWVGRPYRQVASRWHDWWDRHLESQVVRGAQRIVLASPAWVNHFRARYGDRVAEKCEAITNGYDETLIPVSLGEPAGDDGMMTFVNTGAMYGAESPAPFIRALGLLLLRRPELRPGIRVRLIGYAGEEEMVLRELIRNGELEGLVELTGPRPHDECLRAQQGADLLLLFSGTEHVDTLRGKSFEYLSTGKPILALIPPHGAQADILRRAGSALIVEHGDIETTARAIEQFLTDENARRCTPDWDYIRRFERRTLVGALARSLDELVQLAPNFAKER